jgi:large subunit ribosomal protein L29
MKLHELRELTRQELLQRHRDLQEELFNLRMRKSTKALENPLRLRHVGRDIARVMTVLREDQLGTRKLAESKTTILGGGAGKSSNE